MIQLILKDDAPQGWLSPSGEYFGCRKNDMHLVLHSILGFKNEAEAYCSGYLKIAMAEPTEFNEHPESKRDYFMIKDNPTIEQMEWLNKEHIALHEKAEKVNESNISDIDGQINVDIHPNLHDIDKQQVTDESIISDIKVMTNEEVTQKPTPIMRKTPSLAPIFTEDEKEIILPEKEKIITQAEEEMIEDSFEDVVIFEDLPEEGEKKEEEPILVEQQPVKKKKKSILEQFFKL